jgi:hypothetical protein
MKRCEWVVAAVLAIAPVSAYAKELGREVTFHAVPTRSNTYPKVAMDAFGRSVVVWQSHAYGLGESRIYARIHQRGQRLSRLFTIGARDGANQLDPAVDSHPRTKRFVVAWRDRVGDPSRVLAQMFKPSGQPQGPVLVVDDQEHAFQVRPQVVMASDGGFFVLWTGYPQELPDSEDDINVYARRYDAKGKPRGPSFRISETAGSQFPTACGTPSGGFVVTWVRSSESGHQEVVGRFDADGRPVGNERLVPGGPNVYPMCRFEDDGFVLGWTAVENDLQAPYVQVFDSEGQPVADPQPLAADTDTAQPSFQSAAPLAGGGFLATWYAAPSEEGEGDVFGRWMTATGEPASNPFQINVTAAGMQIGIAVASASPRQLMAVWFSAGAPGPWAILGRPITGPPTP